MQKLISLELYAERIPKDPGVLFRDSFPELQRLLAEAWRITHLSASYVNQNVYIISMVLEKDPAFSLQQRLISLEMYADRIPRDPGYLLREHDLAKKEENAAAELTGEGQPELISVQEELKRGWTIQLMSAAYLNENIYVVAFVLEEKGV